MKVKKEKIVLVIIAVIVAVLFLKPLYKPFFESHNDDKNYKRVRMHFPSTECNFNPWAVMCEKQAENMVFDAMSHGQYGIPVDTMKKAIALLQKSISYDSRYQLGYVQLAEYQSQIKDYAGAVATLREAARWLPDNPVIVTVRGNLYDIMNKRNLADKEYLKAISLYNKRLKTNINVSDISSKSIAILFLKGDGVALKYLRREYSSRFYKPQDGESLEMLISAFQNHSMNREEMIRNEMTNPMINFNI
jgi:tetratricopeptide (TPR) repeat protein